MTFVIAAVVGVDGVVLFCVAHDAVDREAGLLLCFGLRFDR